MNDDSNREQESPGGDGIGVSPFGDLFSAHQTAGAALRRIFAESRTTAEQGTWFENLFMRVARKNPEFEIKAIWRWEDWPDRPEGRTRRDTGVDLVAVLLDDTVVAIQCKAYGSGSKNRVTLEDIRKFLGGSQHKMFGHRWLVVTSGLNSNANEAVLDATPPISIVDFRHYEYMLVDDEDSARPVREPLPLQLEAIENVVEGLTNNARGQLIMACGTGKTFTSLRIAEQLVSPPHSILFAAPSIALVSQARREWLEHTTRPLSSLVVCSDNYAGGRKESEDIRINELVCPVTTKPKAIANHMLSGDAVSVVFSTYHSLDRVAAAQNEHGAPAFRLVIADEAHRTTGALSREVKQESKEKSKVDFQLVHDDSQIRAEKRLYMTATPRVYATQSKIRGAKKGIEVVDMSDDKVFGVPFYNLSFKKGVENNILSDYRVIVLGVSEDRVTGGLRDRLGEIRIEKKGGTRKEFKPDDSDITRVLGTSLAINGVLDGDDVELPTNLPRSLGFANSIPRSFWFAKALSHPLVKSAVTKRKEGVEKAMDVVSEHLDASSNAYERTTALNELRDAERAGQHHILTNVRLFTEGVDVPSLDAVAFLDPRESQVDVVQAVGRVMRRAEGKKLGYIVIPIVVRSKEGLLEALSEGNTAYHVVGKVLRALRSHDSRLFEDFKRFVKIFDDNGSADPQKGLGAPPRHGDEDSQQLRMSLLDDSDIYAYVAKESGLADNGKIVADQIIDIVKNVGAVFDDQAMGKILADNLEIQLPAEETCEEGLPSGAFATALRNVCMISALMLCNACLMQKRLSSESDQVVMRLDKATVAQDPVAKLLGAWDSILERDYEPVFRGAVDILGVLSKAEAIQEAIRLLAGKADGLADSLNELGYDHAGPLYHEVLRTAKSDGAFYTNNVSGVMLAQLALSDYVADWSDLSCVEGLRIMDPACGTGTLLMASMRTIKDRVLGENKGIGFDEKQLHKRLVEDVLCGLDINRHAIQLAACNLTLGAPTVDYRKMNLATMPHGPQSDGGASVGTLEVLDMDSEGETNEFRRMLGVKERRMEESGAEQVTMNSRIDYPLSNLDVVIMNPPFTNAQESDTKYGEGKSAMQLRKGEIQRSLCDRDSTAASAIDSNSVRTYFSPLADILLNNRKGTLAMVIPTTACTGVSGLDERKFLGERFHIEMIVTSHDHRSKKISFSENTGIHESLLICRRWDSERPATRFISLLKMPGSRDEAVEVVRQILGEEMSPWFNEHRQPEEIVRRGDWGACQFANPNLAVIAANLEADLVPLGSRYSIGNAHPQPVKKSYKPVHDSDLRVFWSLSSSLHQTLRGEPDEFVRLIPGMRPISLEEKAGHLMIGLKFSTESGRLTALYSDTPCVGYQWGSVRAEENEAKALCAWFNSTPGLLGLLMRRGRKLSYPVFQKAHILEFPVPCFDRVSLSPLLDAFESVKDQEVDPWRLAMQDPVREVLDRAASETIGIPYSEVVRWRELVCREPTISKKSAYSE